MFADKRSKRVVFLAHCVLNQNAKIEACAYYPGPIREVTKALLSRNVGLIQMPCPELLCLGLDREADKNNIGTVESEDTRVAVCMAKELPRKLCQAMVDNIVYQVEEYRRHGFHIVGVIGINGSPTCGVETTWSDNCEHEGQGIFIRMLDRALTEKAIPIYMTGIKATEPKQAVAAVGKLLKAIE